jgi:PST family polysaccharide transporter
MLGVGNLGIYNRAMTLIGTPINTLTTGLQGVLFAASSRAQADTLQLKKAYFAATSVIGLVCFPLAITVAAVPETIILSIYGVQWLAAIPVLPPLAMAMAIHALLAIVGPVLMAQNKVGLEVRAQIIALLAMLPVLYLAACQSLRAVAWGVLGIYLLRWFLLVGAVLPILNTSWKELLRTLTWPLLIAIVTALLTYICDIVLHAVSPIFRLPVDMIAASASMIFMLRIFGEKIMSGSHGDYLLGAGRLPTPIRRLLNL